MADRTLRGSRLGSVSYETDRSVEPVERRLVTYLCPRGHTFSVPLASDADLPPVWTCSCGDTAVAAGQTAPSSEPEKPTRTHWDMLLERRSIADLEVLLDERLQLLHSQRKIPRARKSA